MTDETAESTSVLIDPAPAVIEHAPVEPVPFWQRQNVERFLVPLVTPIVVVVGLVVFVLNLSRVFLSAHGHIAVVVGTVVTVVILLGATLLSNSSRLRSSTISLMTAGFVFVVLSAGWLVLGHSQEKHAVGTALAATGPVEGSFTITAAPTGGLTFGPSSLTVKTGIYLVTLRDGANAQHTLNFDDSTTLWAGLVVNNQGETKKSRIFFARPGDYTFFCAISTHRTNGMQGTVHVTGIPITLAQAEIAGKPAA